MANLNEIGTELMKLEAEMEQAEISKEAFIDTLESSTQHMNFKDKILKCLYFSENKKSNTKELKEKVKRMQARIKSEETQDEWMKSQIQFWMEQTKQDKLEFPEFKVWIQENNPSLQVDEGASIPAKYMTIIPEHLELNKAELKADLKAGKEIPGCRLVQGKSIRIR